LASSDSRVAATYERLRPGCHREPADDSPDGAGGRGVQR